MFTHNGYRNSYRYSTVISIFTYTDIIEFSFEQQTKV